MNLKKYEAIVDSSILRDLLSALDKAGIKSYSILDGIGGSGERGTRHKESFHGERANSMLVVVLPADELPRLAATVAPFIQRHGGIAWASDVMAS